MRMQHPPLRAIVAQILPQALAALLLSGLITIALYHLGSQALAIALFLVLAVTLYFAIMVMFAIAATRRYQHTYGRGGMNDDRGGGNGGSGVREPRHPHPPTMPPEAAAAELNFERE